MRTLVLNAGYEPLHVTSWQRALCLVILGKAEVVSEYQKAVQSLNHNFQKPSVVRLLKYIKVVRHFGRIGFNRKNILIRDKYTCQYCNKKCRPTNITIDHIIPRSKNGGHTWENVVACCQTCNRRKANKLLKDTNMSLRSKPQRPYLQDLLLAGNDDSQLWPEFLNKYKIS